MKAALSSFDRKGLSALRLASAADGISYLYLLYCSIYEKRLLGNEEAIRLPGMIHGVIFTVLAFLLLWCWRRGVVRTGQAAFVMLGALVPLLPLVVDGMLRRREREG